MASPDPNNGAIMPPPNNPVLTAYEGFVRDTPLVSRYVMTTLVVTFLISLLFNGVVYSLANIPYFTVGKLELYRIITSPFVCGNPVSLVLAQFSFLENGKRLEFSMGSAQFGWLIFSLGIMVNASHIVLAYIIQIIMADVSYIFVSASGIWIVLFPLIAIECVKAPPHSSRRLIMWNVPTLWYPVVLLVLFTLLGGFGSVLWVALGIGYAHGYGFLDATKISTDTAKKWEDTILANFTRREGWVYGHAATGSAAWNDIAIAATTGSATSQQKQGLGLFRSAAGGETAVTTGGTGVEAFPSGGGRQLGGPTRRGAGNADARAARLKALEASSNNNPTTTQGDDNV